MTQKNGKQHVNISYERQKKADRYFLTNPNQPQIYQKHIFLVYIFQLRDEEK